MQGARGEGSGERQEGVRGGVASFVAESPSMTLLAPSFVCPLDPSCPDVLTGIETRVQHTRWQGPAPSHRLLLRGPA